MYEMRSRSRHHQIIHTLSVVLVGVAAAASTAGEDHQRSPFEFIRWKDVTPEVKVAGRWYELRAVNDIHITKILDYCKNVHHEKWADRFGDDLEGILDGLNQPVSDHVTLAVRDLDGRQETTLRKIPLTRENRAAIVDARYGDRDESDWIVGTPGVKRQHRDTPHQAFAHLLKRIETARPWAEELISAENAAEDLDDLEWHLTHRFAYLGRVAVDYQAAIDTMRAGLGDGISRGAFAVQIMKFLALFGDGNTRLNRWSDIQKEKYLTWAQFLPPKFSSFVMTDAGGRVVAHYAIGRPMRFVEDEYPYVRSLDGVPVERWLSVAAGIVARGSPQFIRHMAARYSMFVGFVREELGLPDNSTLILELESADRARTRRLPMPVVLIPPAPPRAKGFTHKRLPNDIGYLRIAAMNNSPRFLTGIIEVMDEFRNTKGLIIDVRDNNGGSRDVLRTLFPFFMKEDDPPHVANVAAARVPPGKDRHRPEGNLADRFLYPITSQHWSDPERDTLRRFLTGFKPEWPAPRARFTDWHFFALTPRTSPGYYYYDRPVVVLMNSRCFSATDIFLGAFKGWPNVTLMGTPSGGGNGRPTNLALLPRSNLRVQLSSMASFRHDGTLYDGKGIQPDVILRPSPTDVVGATDSLLDAARARLR